MVAVLGRQCWFVGSVHSEIVFPNYWMNVIKHITDTHCPERIKTCDPDFPRTSVHIYCSQQNVLKKPTLNRLPCKLVQTSVIIFIQCHRAKKKSPFLLWPKICKKKNCIPTGEATQSKTFRRNISKEPLYRPVRCYSCSFTWKAFKWWNTESGSWARPSEICPYGVFLIADLKYCKK